MEGQKKELNNTTIGLMIGTALFFDALQFLLTFIFMGWLVTPLAYGTFWLWFKIKGLNFFSMKRAPILSLGFLIEMIPVIDALPAITLTVTRIAIDSKIKKVVGAIPGGNIALNTAENKMMRDRNMDRVNNMAKLQSRPLNSGRAEKFQTQKREPNNLFSDEAFNKRMKEREEHFERMRQMGQRADQLKYGGGSKEGLEQHLAKSKKEWDIGTGRTPRDEAA